MGNDLNDLLYLARIVEHGSLSAASDALGVSKSLLSQHLARLEERIGVRLIHRTTRKLHITEVGQRYYERCRSVLEEVARADEVIEDVRGVPRGIVRVTSPVNFAQAVLAPVFCDFMRDYPEVEVVLEVTNREVDLISEGFDVALRIAPSVRTSSCVVRTFPVPRHVLVASPQLLARYGEPREPEDLRQLPSVSGMRGCADRPLWQLDDGRGTVRQIAHRPRLRTEDLIMLRHAALAGCGVAELPPLLCRADLAAGTLVRVLPKWALPEMNLYVLFLSRAGMTPALRCFIDFLSLRMREDLRSAIEGSMSMNLTAREAGPAAGASLRRVG